MFEFLLRRRSKTVLGGKKSLKKECVGFLRLSAIFTRLEARRLTENSRRYWPTRAPEILTNLDASDMF